MAITGFLGFISYAFLQVVLTHDIPILSIQQLQCFLFTHSVVHYSNVLRHQELDMFSSLLNMHKLAVILVVFLAITLFSGIAWSEEDLSVTKHTDILTPFLVSTGISLISDDNRGSQKSWRYGEALTATYVAVNVLKHVCKENRPDGSGTDSFPSGHAALAFTSAAVLDSSQPGRGWIGYLAAGLVSWERVEDRKHFWRDVIAGAVIGQVIGKQLAEKDHSNSPVMSMSIVF
jgi:membrane-associated phospholipid phosphatase